MFKRAPVHIPANANLMAPLSLTNASKQLLNKNGTENAS